MGSPLIAGTGHALAHRGVTVPLIYTAVALRHCTADIRCPSLSLFLFSEPTPRYRCKGAAMSTLFAVWDRPLLVRVALLFAFVLHPPIAASATDQLIGKWWGMVTGAHETVDFGME